VAFGVSSILKFAMMKNWHLVIFLLVLGLVGRLFPHLPNFAPLTAIALVAGMRLRLSWAVMVILSLTVFTDLLLGVYDWRIMLLVYVCYFLFPLLGSVLMRGSGVWSKLFGVLAASFIFFIVTNFAVWLFSGMYDLSWPGILECYWLALPFWRNSLLGDLFFTGGLLILLAVYDKRKTRGWRWLEVVR
jgi:hypothetical protein